LPRPQLEKLVRDAQAVSLVSLSQKLGDTDSNRDVVESDVLRDDVSSDPVSEAQKNDVKNFIRDHLNRAERLIIVLYYYERMTMKEIGATLDLSESRVSQVHSAIIAQLRSQVQVDDLDEILRTDLVA
jgi:RNA polymerase sigma factor for flagellar operon FliA